MRDIKSAWLSVAFKGSGDGVKDLTAKKESLLKQFAYINTFLKRKNRTKFVLGYLSYVDVLLYYNISILVKLFKNLLKIDLLADFANIKSLFENF